MRTWGILILFAIIGSLSPWKAQGAANSIAVTATGSYNALDVTSNFNANVATVAETFNGGGTPTYKIMVKSSNGGLKHSTQNLTIPYSVAYSGAGGSTVTISTTDQQIGVRVNPATGTGSGNVSISYTGTPATSLYQGIYTDTLTFTYTKNGTAVNTQTLTLTSLAVGTALSLIISADVAASNLDLNASQTDLLVGTATEASNSTTGYNIKVRSSNGGYLKHALAGGSPTASQKIDYTVKYGASAATIPTTTDAIIYSVGAGVYSGNSSNIKISYSPSGVYQMGVFNDTLTFTIEVQ